MKVVLTLMFLGSLVVAVLASVLFSDVVVALCVLGGVVCLVGAAICNHLEDVKIQLQKMEATRLPPPVPAAPKKEPGFSIEL